MLAGLFCFLAAAQSPSPVVDALQALESVDGHLCVVVARRELSVSSPVAGVLSSVDVDLGQPVRSGQTLFRLDEEGLRHRVAMARATFRSAEAEVARARVAHGQAQVRYERRRDAAGVYSSEEVDTARSQAEITQADLQAAEARLAEQQALVALLEADLEKLRVTAPFDGTIAARFQQAGSTLDAGMPVVRLIAAATPFVRFAVPPTDATRYTPGSDVEVILAGREQPLHARVVGLAPAVDPAIDMVPVEAELILQTDAVNVRVGTIGKARANGTLVPSPDVVHR